jgi:hypothetical protein
MLFFLARMYFLKRSGIVSRGEEHFLCFVFLCGCGLFDETIPIPVFVWLPALHAKDGKMQGGEAWLIASDHSSGTIACSV